MALLLLRHSKRSVKYPRYSKYSLKENIIITLLTILSTGLDWEKSVAIVVVYSGLLIFVAI